MTYIEKLLEACPELAEGKVERKTLGEVFNIKNGYTPSKKNEEYWTDGTIPWFRMEDIRKNGQILDHALQSITKIAVKNGKLFPANSIIMATSATIGIHALITVPFLSNQRFTNLSLKSDYEDLFDIKFLFYYCFKLGDWCKSNTTIGNFAGVDMNGFKKIKIPIPPLSVQQEVVRILDKFTQLTARKKQYAYYRDELLSFKEGEVEWKTLGEVAEYSKKRISFKNLNEENYVGVDNLL